MAQKYLQFVLLSLTENMNLILWEHTLKRKVWKKWKTTEELMFCCILMHE